MTVEIQAYATNLYAALNVSEVFRCLFGGEAYLSHWDIFQRKTSLEIYREREKKKYSLLFADSRNHDRGSGTFPDSIFFCMHTVYNCLHQNNLFLQYQHLQRPNS